MPVNDPKEKQRIAQIAIGDSLSTHYYDNIHSSHNLHQQGKENLFFASDPTDTLPVTSTTNGDIADDTLTKDTNDGNVLEKFNLFYEDVVSKLQQGDEEYRKSILKFVSRYEKFSSNQRTSAFQSFGTVFVGKARGKIKVQPTAVSRRKSKIGSRQKQDTSITKSLPHRRITTKRKHSMTHIIDENVPSAKKAGRSMVSNTKYPIRKNEEIKHNTNKNK